MNAHITKKQQSKQKQQQHQHSLFTHYQQPQPQQQQLPDKLVTPAYSLIKSLNSLQVNQTTFFKLLYS